MLRMTNVAAASFSDYAVCVNEPLPIYILAGGKSSRFGADKALARVGGHTLLESLATTLRPLASSLIVVADRNDKYASLGFETIADAVPGLGPMGGLKTALSDCTARNSAQEWLLLVSCDWAGVRPEWISQLMQARTDRAQVVAFKGENWEPLLALYHVGVAANVEAAIALNQRAMWRLIERSSPVALALPPDWSRAVQVNTPEALKRFLEHSSQGE